VYDIREPKRSISHYSERAKKKSYSPSEVVLTDGIYDSRRGKTSKTVLFKGDNATSQSGIRLAYDGETKT
jgi:hypothetical protein